jgi:hypothetical protein
MEEVVVVEELNMQLLQLELVGPGACGRAPVRRRA